MKTGEKAPEDRVEDYLKWLAGFFDGDGNVTITNRDELYVAIGGNFVETLYELKERFGGTVSRPCGKNGKARQWRIVANQALSLLLRFGKYSRVKREEIDIGIEFQRDRIRLNRGTSQEIRDAQRQWRRDMREMLSSLNRVRKAGERVKERQP